MFLPFVGREEEMTAVLMRLRQEGIRFVTVTGPAGVGKTRLLQEIVREVQPDFSQIICLDLTSLKKTEQVTEAVCAACCVKDQDPGLLKQRLAEAVGTSRLLLVLDNCEHLTGIRADLEYLLSCCDNLKILAGSREMFRSRWEWVFPLLPFTVPERTKKADPDSLRRLPAAQLFTARARLADAGFDITKDNADAAAKLLLHLDGLPLAILLAAGRVGAEAPGGIPVCFSSLSDQDNMSVRSFENSLQQALETSFSLLRPKEAALFRRLSVFSGTFRLREAAVVCSGAGISREKIPELLARLSDLSLLVEERWADSGKKYRFLETVQLYAYRKLQESGEEMLLRKQHRDCFLIWAEQGEYDIWGREACRWLDQIEENYENLRSAMEWCIQTPGEAARGLQIWAAVAGSYDMRGRITEGLSLAAQLLEQAREPGPARARTLLQSAVLKRSMNCLKDAMALTKECLSFAGSLGDVFDDTAARCTEGSLLHILGESAAAEKTFRQACLEARLHEVSEPRLVYVALFWMGSFYCFQGQYPQALEYMEEALAAARHQHCVLFESRILAVLGRILIGKQEFARAQTVLTEGLFVARQLKYYEMAALCFEYLGLGALIQKNRKAADIYYDAADALRKLVGVTNWFPDSGYRRAAAETGLPKPDAAESYGQRMPEQIIVWSLNRVKADRNPSGQAYAAPLSLREEEVCSLIVQGTGNRQIAEQLGISTRTVDAHVRHILNKLNLCTRAQIAAWYIRNGGSF